MIVEFTLNSKKIIANLESDKRLLDYLREDLGLTGTKEGCSEGECGACTVVVDKVAVHSCLTMVSQLNGREVITIEGLQNEGKLDPIQQNFIDEVAIQCGFCTTGMIMSTKALLMNNANPTEEDIRIALSGNLCRCSGYSQIIRAVKKSAKGGN